MNRQIARIALVATLLLAALIVATTYWQTWAEAGLAERQDNSIQRVAQFTIKRGRILASDGRTVLSENVKVRRGGKTLYFRRYPQRGLAAHVVGYSTEQRFRTGIERSENDYLTGANSSFNTVLHTTLDRLRGATVKGNNVILTIDARAQRTAMLALGGQCGAAVAFEPKTGRIRALVSSPTYNPNLIERDFARIGTVRAACSGASALYNRATVGLFAPGSTFKLVTAAAALDTGAFTPESKFYDPGYCIEYGKQVRNAGNPEAPETFGHVNFTTALIHSINSVFCNIGKRLGAKTVLEYAKRFGFYSLPPLETPAGERAASGLYVKHRLFDPKHDYQVDPGRLAFGQEHLLASPLQMAMVAGAIANGGILMRPYVVERIVSPKGSTVTKTKPHKLRRVIKPKTAIELRAMMEGAVESGTGTKAQIPGIRVAGKTGTAETGTLGVNTTWFVCFAPADNPRIAVAVVVENQRGGFGGTVAAPIAKSIMQAILGSSSNNR